MGIFFWLKVGIDLFAVILSISLGCTVYWGVQLRTERGNYTLAIVKKHKQWVIASWIITGTTIVVVEGIVVPWFGRHYSNLLLAHIICCILFLLFFSLASIFNGLKMRRKTETSGLNYVWWHHFFGHLAFLSEVTIAVLGPIVLYRLH